jgi:hypothetical protein
MDNHSFQITPFNIRKGNDVNFNGISYSIIHKKGSNQEMYCITGGQLHRILTDQFQSIDVLQWQHFVNDNGEYKKITRLMLGSNRLICSRDSYRGLRGCGPKLGYGILNDSIVLPILEVEKVKFLSIAMNLHDDTDDLYDVYFPLSAEDASSIIEILNFDLESGFDNELTLLKISDNATIKVISDLSIFNGDERVFRSVLENS